MFKTVKFVEFDDGSVGYNYCRNCHAKKTRRKWGYCFCSRGCMESWIDRNRLIFLALRDYKDLLFKKTLDVKKLFSLQEAKKKILPTVAQDLNEVIVDKFRSLLNRHTGLDSIELLIALEDYKKVKNDKKTSKDIK